MQMQDKEIFQRIKEGDKGAFNYAFEMYYPRLCFFADKMLHDLDLSRSVVQQVFVDFWIKRENLNVLYSLKSYLFHSVRNGCLDMLKHRRVEARFLASLTHPEEQAVMNDLIEEAELNARINAAIQELPRRCREIFVLCRFEELKYTEIADRLGISVKTVEMQVGIALKKLRDKLSVSQMISLLSFLFSKKSHFSYRV